MLAKYVSYIAFSLNFQSILMSDSCVKQLTCSDCITDPSGCVWCSLNEFNETRCKLDSSYEKSWCPKEHVENPKFDVKPLKDKDFSSKQGNVIQIKPQRYKLKLRPGQAVNFNFSFQAVKDYPVDLYFLLDMSDTMSKYKAMAAEQSESIYQTLQKRTNNVFLGFGTFIDKNVLPMTDIINSEKTYSFKPQLKLTKKYEDFKNIVSKTPPGSNKDEPEGGLDALAQVIVCKDIIGWRDESRKIIVFLTDGPYHAAGDGRTAGIFKPYDGLCYTNGVNYTKELEMDYPSVSMINKLATEHQMTILFVVPEDANLFNVYKKLSNSIRGSEYAILPSADDEDDDYDKANLVTILNGTYDEITKKIKLKPSMRRKYGGLKNYRISFDPECSDDNSHSSCELKLEEEKRFVGTIKLLGYDGTNNALIDIAVEGLSETLTLEIEVINSCDCEVRKENSTYCNGEIRECGICRCSDLRYGDKCACIKNTNNPSNDDSTCNTKGSKCNHRGSCVCGSCVCNKGYAGQYCQCDNTNCKRSASGALCNGEHAGICECGACKCKPEWSGDTCECYKPKTNCIGKNNSICDNHGDCVCGSCICHKHPWDMRNQDTSRCGLTPCPDCHNKQCFNLDKCTLCHLESKGDCSCDGVDIQFIDILPTEYLNSTKWNICPNIWIDAGCFTRYVYQYDDVNYRIKLVLQKDKDCGQKYYLTGGICLITLILIGVLTFVLWKLLTDARDRREYKKFIEHQKEGETQPCNNDLYQPASIKYINPVFGKRSFKIKQGD